jgi:hypothetical protein
MNLRIPVISLLLTLSCFAANTNKVDKTEKDEPPKADRDRKTEHEASKIKLTSKDKKDADTPSKWSTDQEFKLMFSNNPKAKKPKDLKAK